MIAVKNGSLKGKFGDTGSAVARCMILIHKSTGCTKFVKNLNMKSYK